MTVKWIRCALGFLCLPMLQALNAAETDVLKAQQARVEVVQKVATSVVAIFSADGNGGGSGVLISADGYALSNYHVTSACGDFMKCGLNDGKLYDAVIVGIDPTGDVAVLKLLDVRDGQSVLVGHRFSANRHGGDRQRAASVSIPGRDAARIHRLHSGRYFDQSGELGWAAVQCGGRTGWHQRADLGRKARSGECRGGLLHFDQPDQALSRPSQGRPRCRSRDAGCDGPNGGGSHRAHRLDPRTVRCLSTRAARGR